MSLISIGAAFWLLVSSVGLSAPGPVAPDGRVAASRPAVQASDADGGMGVAPPFSTMTKRYAPDVISGEWRGEATLTRGGRPSVILPARAFVCAVNGGELYVIRRAMTVDGTSILERISTLEATSLTEAVLRDLPVSVPRGSRPPVDGFGQEAGDHARRFSHKIDISPATWTETWSSMVAGVRTTVELRLTPGERSSPDYETWGDAISRGSKPSVCD